MSGFSIRTVLIVLAVAILAVEGFFVYRFYQNTANSGNTTSETATDAVAPEGTTSGGITSGELTSGGITSGEITSGGTTPEETTSVETTASVGTTSEGTVAGSDETAFVHYAAADNIVGNTTYIDNPATNDKPNALVSATQDPDSGGDGTYNGHPIGVAYDADRGEWAIFNEDLAPMPEGAAFNVIASENPS